MYSSVAQTSKFEQPIVYMKGYTVKEQEVIDLMWKKFQEWMRGQTVGINEDGSYEYYAWDVKRFIDRMPKLGE